MLKSLQKKFHPKSLKTIIIIASIYCLFFNSQIFIHNSTHHHGNFFHSLLDISMDLIFVYGFTLIIFFGLAINKTVFNIGTILLFISGAIASYYFSVHDSTPTKQAIKLLFNKDTNGALKAIDLKFLVWLIFCLLICIYTIKYYKFEDDKLFINKFLSAICLLFVINNIIATPYKILRDYFPLQYLHDSYAYLSDKSSFKNRALDTSDTE